MNADDGVKHCTALHMAARRELREDRRGSPSTVAPTSKRATASAIRPWRRAVNLNQLRVAALLLARGADPHSRCKKGLTPQLAARADPPSSNYSLPNHLDRLADRVTLAQRQRHRFIPRQRIFELDFCNCSSIGIRTRSQTVEYEFPLRVCPHAPRLQRQLGQTWIHQLKKHWQLRSPACRPVKLHPKWTQRLRRESHLR